MSDIKKIEQEMINGKITAKGDVITPKMHIMSTTLHEPQDFQNNGHYRYTLSIIKRKDSEVNLKKMQDALMKVIDASKDAKSLYASRKSVQRLDMKNQIFRLPFYKEEDGAIVFKLSTPATEPPILTERNLKQVVESSVLKTFPVGTLVRCRISPFVYLMKDKKGDFVSAGLALRLRTVQKLAKGSSVTEAGVGLVPDEAFPDSDESLDDEDFSNESTGSNEEEIDF